MKLVHLSDQKTLAGVAATDTFEYKPPKDHYWIVLFMVVAYSGAPVPDGEGLAWIERHPYGADNSVTLMKHPTGNFSVMPVVDGCFSQVEGPYPIVGVRKQYLGLDDKLKVRLSQAGLTGRVYSMRGLAVEAHITEFEKVLASMLAAA